MQRCALGPAVVAAALGLRFGTFVASGADAYGYVSQADLWLNRTFILEQPFNGEAPWRWANWTLSPLGYRPGDRGGTMVPTYPPGLPMLMAVFKAIGGERAVYVVVPLRRAGRRVFAVLDEVEREPFKARCRDVTDISWLDRPPALTAAGGVYFYEVPL